MGNATSRHRPQTILYVAATDDAAQNGATALEQVSTGPKRAVHPTTSIERVRNWAPNVDCVVFAETPTTPAGAHLLEVADACGPTPLVLFSEPAYGATAARSTDGIDGYVRRDTDNAIAHLADEITWLCYGDNNAVTAAESTTPSTQASSALAAAADLIARRDRDRLFERLVETAAETIGVEACWIATVNFGELVPQTTAAGVDATAIEPVSTGGPFGEAFRAGESLRLSDLEARSELESPWSGARSLCSVPIADIGVLQIAGDTPEAFDDADVSLLESLCAITGAVLERNRAETRLTAERDRLQNELDDRTSERNRLAEEQTVIGRAAEHLAAERDHFRAAFSSAPMPMLRYELDGPHSNADATREARSGSISETDTDSEPDRAPKAVITDVNTAFETTFGEERDTVLGQPVSDYTVPSGVRDRATALTEALRAGDRRELECRRETTDGIREFSVTVVPLERAARDRRDGGDDEIDPESTPDSAPAARPTGILYFTDTTDRTRKQRALTAATRRLDTIATLLEDEVQTPLNVARGYLELVEKTGDSDHFEVIDDAHLQLTDHVESLYELAATDDTLADTEPVAIHDVARRAWLTVDTGDAELVVDSTLMLEADRVRLHDLFEGVLQLVVAEDDRETGAVPSSVTVTVGATEDGFYVARDGPVADDPRFDPASEGGAEEGTADADGDGTAHRSTVTASATDPNHNPDDRAPDGARELVEQIADAHGWDVGIAADEARTAFAFRGVDSVDL
ncbi:GAF domain-containing protein [Natrialba asiatica]|uniref:Nitrogen specific signal transduction histidine kinase NtrB n=1 Tax=Natrialba asiatica (strain ATCC 700177 / DSM 12278 / JCM 9576 / FERM P-10747 / NBRC 102637 / 172P1) TaxID=29540 RepID=M0AHV2_NATA1|nr:GAF domain-containing protein [Natrialba asiatica]ELY97946.1 nitrogen specific signal transduction histidine kinase NtrB [Natrialba asiatica DSM 12278]